jgi:NADPH:quinone reductase-like Zn-dependent oxidoreductase
MKAAMYENYGAPEVVQIKEIEQPKPNDHEVCIKVFASTVTSADWRVRSLTVPAGFGLIMRLVFGISKPKQAILGSELAGVIDSVGSKVTEFSVGDPVFAFNDAAMGCHAEYKCMPHNGLVVSKPVNLSFDEAAALSFGGSTALDFLRKGKLQKGEKILVNGASGSVGTALVQLAKHFGANVTAVCSGVNVDLLKSIGADHVIDYTQEDFTKNGEVYDVIVDTVGTAPFSRCKASLGERGRLLLVLAGLSDMLGALLVSLTSNKKVIAGPVTTRVEDLRFLARLAEAGEFKPVIDKRFPFEQIVEAHRHVDSGRKRGNLILTFEHAS